MAKKQNSSSVTTSGAKAVKTGALLEKLVETVLTSNGYKEFWNHKEQLFESRHLLGGKQYSKQVYCGETIYGTRRKVDFLIVNKDLFPDALIIECKWQQSGGTVDEKFPYLLFNIIKTGIPTVVLIDGSGYRPAALKFLKDESGKEGALKAAWDMQEFSMKANNGFLGTTGF